MPPKQTAKSADAPAPRDIAPPPATPEGSSATSGAAPAPAADGTLNVVEAADAADVLVEDVLTWRLVGDRLTVVTRDGRKIEVAV